MIKGFSGVSWSTSSSSEQTTGVTIGSWRRQISDMIHGSTSFCKDLSTVGTICRKQMRWMAGPGCTVNSRISWRNEDSGRWTSLWTNLVHLSYSCTIGKLHGTIVRCRRLIEMTRCSRTWWVTILKFSCSCTRHLGTFHILDAAGVRMNVYKILWLKFLLVSQRINAGVAI